MEQSKGEHLNIIDSVLDNQGKLYSFEVPDNLDEHRKKNFSEEYKPSAEKLQQLETFNFNVKELSVETSVQLVLAMFDKFQLLEEFNIPREGFQNFLSALPLSYRSSNVIPFHNFQHAFTVTQMIFISFTKGGASQELSKYEMFCLLLSALTHDLDHPGFSNGYHNSRITSLALLYNNQSPLENHHCACAFKLFLDPQISMFKNHDAASLQKFRAKMIKLILATDLASHSNIMSAINKLLSDNGGKLPDIKNRTEEERDYVLILLIKAADISNETRPFEVARMWGEKLLDEFFHQGDVERSQGLVVTPFMDRTKVTLKGAQTGFIQFILIPTFEAVVKILPQMQEGLDNVKVNLAKYEKMESDLTDKSEGK
eukprot:TRINITY_DN22758_c0_g1_i1.p1 TRINITY_DN22758_c0_g1~~TRINITY_DN22758_c0_g1_i1.p1  ORF type:complete len:392 (-),score=61.31 TRINITY_DN22758_c0_g1_i1:63-1175(-)